MANVQIYRSVDDDWATSAEIVLNDPIPGDKTNLNLGVESKNPVEFVVFAASTPEGRVPPYLDCKLEILDSNLQPLSLSTASPNSYLSPDKRLAILVRADANQRGWYACNGVGLHPPSRAPLNKSLGVIDSAGAI